MVQQGDYDSVVFEMDRNPKMMIHNHHGIFYSDNFLSMVEQNNETIV